MSPQIKMICVIFPYYSPLFYYWALESYAQIKLHRANVYQRGPMLMKISFGIEGLISIWN